MKVHLALRDGGGLVSPDEAVARAWSATQNLAEGDGDVGEVREIISTLVAEVRRLEAEVAELQREISLRERGA
jgi:uncharacterized small protein (DUF1192 family)